MLNARITSQEATPTPRETTCIFNSILPPSALSLKGIKPDPSSSKYYQNTTDIVKLLEKGKLLLYIFLL